MSIADKLITIAENVPKVYAAGKAAGGGGGSVDGYATVTFMNGDEVLFSRLVLKGDDCPDPYVQNRIELPTKESTAQYNYTFNGWSGTDNGTADVNVLKNITADKTIYAAYDATVRTYTVSFYDGDTCVHTEDVPYGGSSDYKYQKAELMFVGWTPAPTNITGDMKCYGEWIDKPNFASSSWETIKQISESGQAAETFNIGDERDITLTYADGTTEVVTLQIVDFNKVASEVNQTNSWTAPATVLKTAGITMTTKHVMGAPQKQHTSSSTSNVTNVFDTAQTHAYFGGNYSCALYDYVHTEIYNALPADLVEVLEPQYVRSAMNQYVSGMPMAAVYDTVTLLPVFNITGEQYKHSSTSAYSTSGALCSSRFAWFENENNRKKTKRDGTAASYWLANGYQYNSMSYRGVIINETGTAEQANLNVEHYVVPVISI